VDDGREPVDVAADLAAGSIATVLALDRPEGGLTLRVVLDAVAPAVVPRGGVEAGGGGLPRLAWPAVALPFVLAAVRGRRRFVVLTAAAVVAGLVPAPAAAGPAAADRLRPVVVDTASTASALPTRLRVPAAAIDAPLGRVGLDPTGALDVPADGATAGWYAHGPAPGAPGPAVLTGHVDGRGAPAVFGRLHELRAGDAVFVDRADGSTVRFVVSGVARHPKQAFPTAAVYGPTARAEVRLITCGGAFDRATGSYLDNVIVWAVPV
jgi:hypothetical protein